MADNVPLLVATSNALLLVTPDGGVRRLHEGTGLYYGLAVSGSQVFVACRRNPGGRTPRAQERGAVLVLDAEDLSLVGTLAPP